MTTARLVKLRSGIPRVAARQTCLTAKQRYARNRTLAAFDEAAHLDISRIRFWNQEVVLVNEASMIHEVLVSEADAFRKGPLLTRNARPVLGKGLLSSDNELNRRQRKIISPAFAHRKIADYAELVVSQTEQVSSSWQDGATMDLPSALLAIAFQITDRLLFGRQSAADGDAILRSLPILMNFAIDELRSPLRAAAGAPRAVIALARLHSGLRRRISARRRRGFPGADTDEADLLDTLLFGNGDRPAEAMPGRLARDEAMTTFLAGIETVAMSIAWTLYLLIRNPESLKLAQDEADSVHSAPKFEDLKNTPFLLQALKESLRLYPPAYILAREAVRDVTIGLYTMRRRTVVFVSPYLRHRNPEYFDNPEVFDPRRWSSSNFERDLPRYSYMPFGGGQHVCVGGHFALMQGHLILAALLQKFRFELIEGQTIEPEPLFTLRPRDGIAVSVFRR